MNIGGSVQSSKTESNLPVFRGFAPYSSKVALFDALFSRGFSTTMCALLSFYPCCLYHVIVAACIHTEHMCLTINRRDNVRGRRWSFGGDGGEFRNQNLPPNGEESRESSIGGDVDDGSILYCIISIAYCYKAKTSLFVVSARSITPAH
jgi:hypothetical protein